MGLLRAVILTAVATSSVLACGSADSSAPAGGSDCTGGCWKPTAADEDFFSEACTLTEACCIANGRRQIGAPDVEGCKKLYRTAGLSRDAALRSACLSELKSLAAGINCLPEAWDLSDACVRLTFEPSGPQAPGEPCVNRADCQGAPGKVTLCAGVSRDFSPTFGLCTQVTRGTAGTKDPCLGTVSPGGVIAVAPRYVAGQHQPMTTGVVCEEHAGIQCGEGDDPTSWTCQTLGASGAVCRYSQTCASKECLTSEGADARFDLPGNCTPRVPAGQACESLPRALCDASSFCKYNQDPNIRGGICQPKLPAGSSCQNDLMCSSATCDSSTSTCSIQTPGEEFSLLAFCGGL